MKICPICRTQFEDDLNFCLNDGCTLRDFNSFNPNDSIAVSDKPTLEYRSQQTENQNKQTYPPVYTPPQRQSHAFAILRGIFALILLLIGAGFGGFLYVRYRNINREPTPTPYYDYFTPYRPLTPTLTPTPASVNNIKVEILDKIEGSFGQKYLKCKITNISENIVASPSVTLSFYQNDVKIKDASATSELKFLKPNQTVPIWVNIYGVDKYTSVKVKEPVTARTINQPEEKVFPKIILSDTTMNGEKGGLSYNFRSYTKIFYKVRGIAESETDMASSTVLFVIYKDENSEIVGIGNTRLTNLKSGEKTKFEISKCEIDLFGTPKTFEIIAVNDSVY